MLQKFKHISSIVLLFFFGASMLQSISPLLVQQISHHSEEKMVCNIDGDCDGTSCSVDGNKSCSCNHASNNQKANRVTLCGCDHNDNEPIGTTSPFQIKAPLLSVFDGITFSPKTVITNLHQAHSFIFTDDIFHPPRLSA